jgi:hypothetical protein
MNVWLDGLGVLANLGGIIAGILSVIIWGQVVIVNTSRKIFKDRLTRAEYFSLGMAGWILPVALAALLFFCCVYLFDGNIGAAGFTSLIIFFLYAVSTIRPVSGSWLIYFVLILFLLGSVFLHLAFLRTLILPLYFDSAEHYRIIKYFQDWLSALSGDVFPSWPLVNYYHVGYHFLIAFVSTFLKINTVDTMLVFGQILVSVLPLSLFFIVRRETGSDIAALFTSLLAGFGWQMPGYAVNWGKYPALFSLVCIHFVLCVTYLIFRNNTFRLERPKLFLILGLGILISGFIHTRSLIVYGFLALSLFLFILWKRLPVFFQYVSLVLVLGVFAVEVGYIRIDSMLEPLLNTYVRNDVLMIGLVLLLVFFSVRTFVEITFFSLIMLSLLLSGLFIPVNEFFLDYEKMVLLDRPYIQMLLYIPLSILGGLGLAGINQFLQKISFVWKDPSRLVNVMMFGCVIVATVFNYDFYPSSCCQIAGRDDLVALDWMDKKLPMDANVLIASVDMYVTSAEQANSQVGVDGGIWITPLISRRTIFISDGLSFDQHEIRDEICSGKSNYIYVGGETLSFNNLLPGEHPEWYQIVLSLPHAKLYKIIECK